MTDLDTLLAEASRLQVPPTTPGQIDADVARGRRMLRRRRARRLGYGAGVAGVLVAGSLLAGAALDGVAGLSADPSIGRSAKDPGHGTGSPTPGTPTGGSVARPAIQLVAYTGRQAPGYTVDKVPDRWVLQGADSAALVIAEPDDPDKDLNSWLGKLVVMLASNDQKTPSEGTKVMVGKRPGVVSHADPAAAQLFFTDPRGRLVVIQAPPSLHWSDAELAAFGAGLHVNAHAVAGNG